MLWHFWQPWSFLAWNQICCNLFILAAIFMAIFCSFQDTRGLIFCHQCHEDNFKDMISYWFWHPYWWPSWIIKNPTGWNRVTLADIHLGAPLYQIQWLWYIDYDIVTLCHPIAFGEIQDGHQYAFKYIKMTSGVFRGANHRWPPKWMLKLPYLCLVETASWN